MYVQLRPYQMRMVQEVGCRNVIVKMPTGSGKTLVAAECMRLALQRGSSDGNCRNAVFLVPTRNLVEQQAQAVRRWCTELRVKEYMGTLAVPSSDSFNVLVATPVAATGQGGIDRVMAALKDELEGGRRPGDPR